MRLNGKHLGVWGFVKPEKYDFKTDLDEVSRLLWVAVQQYAKFNYAFCAQYPNNPDFPFDWGELQNLGIWFHSFYEALNQMGYEGLVIPEYPFTKSKYQLRGAKLRKTRRVDFCIWLREKKAKAGVKQTQETVLLIEYKHMVVESSEISDKRKKYLSKSDWEKLRQATLKSNREQFMSLREVERSRIVKVCLTTVVIRDEFESEAPDSCELVVKKRRFADQINQIKCIGLGPAAKSWSAWWWLPEERQKETTKWKDSSNNDYWYSYKGLYFLAGVGKAPRRR